MFSLLPERYKLIAVQRDKSVSVAVSGDELDFKGVVRMALNNRSNFSTVKGMIWKISCQRYYIKQSNIGAHQSTS